LPSNKTATIGKPEIKIITTKDGTLVCLSGRVDMDSSPAVRDQLLVVMQAADHKIVSIDLSAVTHFDSSGIATLIEVLRFARNSKTQLSLRGLHGRLLHLFEVTGLLDLFNGSTEISQPGYKVI